MPKERTKLFVLKFLQSYSTVSPSAPVCISIDDTAGAADGDDPVMEIQRGLGHLREVAMAGLASVDGFSRDDEAFSREPGRNISEIPMETEVIVENCDRATQTSLAANVYRGLGKSFFISPSIRRILI